MKKFFLFFIDLLWPSRCVSCGNLVRSSMNHFCSGCYSMLKVTLMSCPVCCGIIINNTCSICGNRKFYPARNISLFSYNETARLLIHSLKFRGLKNIYRIFIPFICSKLTEFGESIDIISYVPMNRRKLIKRGYNQSELIAEAVSKHTGIGFYKILKEKKNSISQRKLNYNERFINVIDRYESININKFQNKVILLIDDVFTTGATINECSRTLINSGAAKVFTITVVRSDLKKLEDI